MDLYGKNHWVFFFLPLSPYTWGSSNTVEASIISQLPKRQLRHPATEALVLITISDLLHGDRPFCALLPGFPTKY